MGLLATYYNKSNDFEHIIAVSKKWFTN